MAQPQKRISRHIPLIELYSMFQLEYVCYKFREFLYERQCDKKKFNDIALKKKEKIESIAFRNRLPSIFNDAAAKEKYLNKFFNDNGLPNFQYRDDYQRKVKGYWDKMYFFKKGVNIKVKIGDQIEISEVQSIDAENNRVKCIVGGKLVEVSFDQVQRIIPSDFFDKFV